ncbi:MAG: hypothetical protein ACI4SB_03650 [Acutalibacteraceae bacterium]
MYRLREFMRGRYGLDPLNIFLVVLGCILTFVLSFVGGRYYKLIGLIPYIFVIIRALSTNIDARQKENEKFMKLWLPVYGFFSVKYKHSKDKEHRYFKCPECKHTLRVPKGKGKIEITCPFCSRKFKKRT